MNMIEMVARAISAACGEEELDKLHSRGARRSRCAQRAHQGNA